MTYENDPNRNPRTGHPMTEDTSYTSWIIGGVAVFAVLMGLFFMFGRDDKVNTASTTNRPAVTAPATTGSGSTSVIPRNDAVQPTNPAGNVPTAPTSR